MKHFTIFSLMVLVAICALADASCRRRNRSCTDSIQCCSKYCRNGQCIKYGDVDDDVGENPCNLVDCGPESVCVLQQVQCFRAPCPPIATCVPRNLTN